MDTSKAPSPLLVDPRYFQIAVLSSLLLYGIFFLDLEIRWPFALLILSSAIGAQMAFSKIFRTGSYDIRSALISALSLCLLLRTNSWVVALLAALLAIGSKFVLRIDKRHIFNPTNFAIAVMILTNSAWISPGQWGSKTVFALFLLCAGALVVRRAERSDITIAFLLIHSAILFGRAFILGDPLTIPLHQLSNGALLIFAFFMISDPKTTPDTRLGRIFFAGLVSVVAWYIQFRLFRPNGLILALIFCSPLVVLINRLLKGKKYEWRALPLAFSPASGYTRMGIYAALLLLPAAIYSFCGFYVAKADSQMFNKASQVVLARSGDSTFITMVSDFKGDPKEFAVVIPVPTVIKKEQILILEKAVVDHIDAFTAPRLVEYYDPDPCNPYLMEDSAPLSRGTSANENARPTAKFKSSLGVTIEAQYSVGEYDIIILSAKQSDGLQTWLNENGYRMPRGAQSVLGSYIRQNMKFFLAKVNLERQSKAGYTFLRPIRVSYNSPKFMLPVRLGTVNSTGTQDLIIYGLSPAGRIETLNYRTVKLPTDLDIPQYVRDEFPQFYRDMFSEQVRRHDTSVVFLEYAWDMGWCDPCASEPLTVQEQQSLGAFWAGSGRSSTYVTRLHLRYDSSHFPEDLVFQQTSDRGNFQGRYVLHRPWTGTADCDAAKQYKKELAQRLEKEAENLASLTGRDISDIRKRNPMPR